MSSFRPKLTNILFAAFCAALYRNTEEDAIRTAAAESLPLLRRRVQKQHSLDAWDLLRALSWSQERNV